jgi:hypothetical protein
MEKPNHIVYTWGKVWKLNDRFHREDGPAIEWAEGSGDKCWYLYGELHREDGPAFEGTDGVKIWFLNGELHREDGPAVEEANGCKEWWYQGKKLDCNSQEEFERLMKLKAFW